MDTGRAGTIYGQTPDEMLDKSFFQYHGLLPKPGYKLEALHTVPAPDFQSLGAGSFAISKSTASYTGVASSRGNVGWNFGADKTKALFIVGNMHALIDRMVVFLHDGQPTTNEAAGAKGLGLRYEMNDGSTRYYRSGSVASANGWNNAAGWSTLSSPSTTAFSPLQNRSVAVAIYVDTSGGGVFKTFMRGADGQWHEMTSDVTNHLAVVRCASILFSPNTARKQHFGTAIGIYAE